MLDVSKKIKYVSLSYILVGLFQISSKAFCQKKLFASRYPFLHKSLAPKMSGVFHPIAWLINLPWQKISFSHIYCTPKLYPFKKTRFHIPYLHGRLFRRWNFHRKNSQLVMIMWSSHIYRYSALHLHCDLVNPLYSLFLWFLWYIALDFVHFSILWSSYILPYISPYLILWSPYISP